MRVVWWGAGEIRRRGRRVPAAIAMFAVLSACGSTVQWSDTIAEAGPDGSITQDGLSLDDPSARPRDALADKADGASGTRTEGTPSTTLGGVATRSGLPDAGRPSSPRGGGSGRGFTDKEIFIGYTTFKAAEEFGSQAGFTGVEFGDQEAQARAVIDEINAAGGIAGRKIVPVFYDVKTEQALQSPSGVAQAACARWTEDRPVFAAINSAGGITETEQLAACLAKRQTPLVETKGLFPHSILLRHAPHLYTPTRASIERLVPTWVQRIGANGYFAGGWDADRSRPGVEPTKVGILVPRWEFGAHQIWVLRKELERRGHEVVDTYEAQDPNGADPYTQVVVSFRRAGVTHVVGGINPGFYFSAAAASQEYWPRYSFADPLELGQRLFPKGQLRGTLGVGIEPLLNVDNARDPGPTSAAQTRCRKIMQEAGQNTSSRTTFAVMARACDAFNFIATTVHKGDLSAAGMQRGAQVIGSMKSASTFRVSFPGGRLDGAAAVRDVGFREECPGADSGCFVYLSPENHGM